MDDKIYFLLAEHFRWLVRVGIFDLNTELVDTAFIKAWQKNESCETERA